MPRQIAARSGATARVKSPASYADYVLATQPANLIAYWKLDELSGSAAADSSGNGRGATYNGAALGQPVVGHRAVQTCPAFDGSASYVNAYSAGLASAWSGQQGTIALWLRAASAGVWNDGVTRRIAVFGADISNRILIERSTANNLSFVYYGGGTQRGIGPGMPATTDWFHVALVWDQSRTRMQCYIDGWLVGSDSTIAAFTGSLASNYAEIGGGGTGVAAANIWSGNIAHVALWNTALKAAEIGQLAWHTSTGRRLTCDGDSRTVAANGGQVNYNRQLMGLYASPAWRPAGYAVGGQTVAQMRDDAMLEVDPFSGPGNLCVIFGGLNDATAGASAATIWERLQQYILQRKAAGFKVVVCTEIDCQSAGAIAAGWSGTVMPALNSSIKSNAAAMGYTVCDLAADARLMNANDTTYFSADKIHQTTAGYGVIAGLVKAIVDTL